MVQRRMPSGQGPARGGVRPTATPGPRPSAQRVAVRRAPRLDPPARTSRTRIGDSPDRRGGLRRPDGPARRTRAPRAPRRISGRAAALILLAIGLIFAYAYPVRVYLAQESQIEQLENQQRGQRQRIQDLNARVAQWANDDYVIAQAASRLHLVPKGHLLYVVGTDDPATGGAAAPADTPWYSQIWSGIQAADNPPPAKPKPAK
jgi:cell division protein FtsB